MSDVSPIPEGFNTVSCYLVIPKCAEALPFYAKAFGAETTMVLPGPVEGSTMHAEMRIGNSIVMMADANPQWDAKAPQELGGTAVSMHLYVDDADALYQQALDAGCTVKMPLTDMFWGDRFGKVEDPYGHQWSIASRKEIVSPEEMAVRQQKMMEEMAQQMGAACQDS